MTHPDGHQIIYCVTSYFMSLFVSLRFIISAQPGGQIWAVFMAITCFYVALYAYSFLLPVGSFQWKFDIFTSVLISHTI